MQENNEQVVNEEVKPVEIVPTEVETVSVDEIVGHSDESNNNNNSNVHKGRSPRELILVVIAALTMIASGLYFAFTSEDDTEGSDEEEIVEIEDNEQEEDTSEVKPTTYYTNSFNSEKYDFNVMKNPSTNDTITEHDLSKEGKEITYTFTIKNKKVVVSNSYGSKYTISKIKNAKQLLIASMGQSPRTGAFIITEDNNLYSIGLYGDSENDQVITDCKKLENVVKKEINDVKTISSGSLVEKNTTGGEGVVLIETKDNKKYVLATREIKD